MIITRTPFRLPLGGGGTDLPAYYERYGGFLITAAINKYMYININRPALVNKIKLNYTKTEIVNSPGELKHELVRECLKLAGVGAPIEIHSMADLSGGTGLGSSSTYTVGLLNGLSRITHQYISIQELAETACKIEIEMVGKPIGKQDQYAAAFGGIIVLKIDTAGKVEVIPLQLHNEIVRDFENHLMLFYTDIERDANEILSEQSRKLKTGDPENAPREDPVQMMHEIKEIGYRSKAALENGETGLYGKLMHQHWMIKKRISNKMSNPQIDRWYETAMNSGAIGGKIMGAGGGGFFLFCAETGKRKSLRSTLEKSGLRYMDFRFDFEGSKDIANV
jgi:D-glycero-alpha-D-manno-heptose-7-phosphate kinase